MTTNRAENDAEQIRQIERDRLRSLVEKEMALADRLHADDFQLITPSGRSLTKSQYLGGIASGALNYRLWEIDSEIDIQVSGDLAVIRYRSRLHMARPGIEGEALPHWHMDVYARRDGSWQIVWSQATEIATA